MDFRNFIEFDAKYLVASRHQLHFSRLVPFTHTLALGVNTDMSIGYTYRLGESGFYPYFGGQVRYWRFDLEISGIALSGKWGARK